MSVLPKVLNLEVLPIIILTLIIKMIGIWSCTCVCVCDCTCASLILLSMKVEITQWLWSHVGITFTHHLAGCMRSSSRELLLSKLRSCTLTRTSESDEPNLYISCPGFHTHVSSSDSLKEQYVKRNYNVLYAFCNTTHNWIISIEHNYYVFVLCWELFSLLPCTCQVCTLILSLSLNSSGETGKGETSRSIPTCFFFLSYLKFFRGWREDGMLIHFSVLLFFNHT